MDCMGMTAAADKHYSVNTQKERTKKKKMNQRKEYYRNEKVTSIADEHVPVTDRN